MPAFLSRCQFKILDNSLIKVLQVYYNASYLIEVYLYFNVVLCCYRSSKCSFPYTVL